MLLDIRQGHIKLIQKKYYLIFVLAVRVRVRIWIQRSPVWIAVRHNIVQYFYYIMCYLESIWILSQRYIRD